MEDEIIVIDKIEEAEDNKGKTYLKITDKAGVTRNFKEGRSKLLTNKGHLLEEGKAIKLHFEDYKTQDGKIFPFVRDFEAVEDIFVAQATKRVQSQVKTERNDSIESQVAFKGMVELLIADKLDEDERNVTIGWAMERLDLPQVIVEKIEGAKGETIKDNKDNKKTQAGLTDRQDSRETTEGEPKTAGEFLTWLTNKKIKAPRTWLEVEWGVGSKEILTLEKIQGLYKEIKEKKEW